MPPMDTIRGLSHRCLPTDSAEDPKKKPGEPLRGRCDSFVVETDVHYPTDVSLLWDAMRCLLRETGRASGEHAVGGWRQWRYLTREVRSLFNRVRSTRRAKRHPERVEAYLARCRGLVERAVDTLDALRNPGVDAVTCGSIEGYVAHALRQIDQVERRLVRGETIPHEEKVFSIFEEHTRWVSKGKAGTPVELGVPVALIPSAPPGGERSHVRAARRLQAARVAEGSAPAESAGPVSGVAGVQLRPGLSQPGQSGRAGRAARPERVAEEGTPFER